MGYNSTCSFLCDISSEGGKCFRGRCRGLVISFTGCWVCVALNDGTPARGAKCFAWRAGCSRNSVTSLPLPSSSLLPSPQPCLCFSKKDWRTEKPWKALRRLCVVKWPKQGLRWNGGRAPTPSRPVTSTERSKREPSPSCWFATCKWRTPGITPVSVETRKQQPLWPFMVIKRYASPRWYFTISLLYRNSYFYVVFVLLGLPPPPFVLFYLSVPLLVVR